MKKHECTYMVCPLPCWAAKRLGSEMEGVKGMRAISILITNQAANLLSAPTKECLCIRG